MRRNKQVRTHVDIRVVSVGGGGGSAVNFMIQAGLRGAKFITIHSDARAQANSYAQTRIQIGSRTTRGLGAAGNYQQGERAAYESMREIRDALLGADLLFLTAGLGGGTGSGAVPVVAEIAQELGILTVALVTTPFSFEGEKPRRIAREAISRLHHCVDSLIVLENDQLMRQAPQVGMEAALQQTDRVLQQGMQVIIDLIHNNGLINIDFADMRKILSHQGTSLMAFGQGQGNDRAQQAAENLLQSPLLSRSLSSARGLLVNITASADISAWEIDKAVRMLQNLIAPQASFAFGTLVDPRLQDEMRLTLIATGMPLEGDMVVTPRPSPLSETRPQPLPPPSKPAPAARPKRNRFSMRNYPMPAFLQNR